MPWPEFLLRMRAAVRRRADAKLTAIDGAALAWSNERRAVVDELLNDYDAR